MTISQIRHQVGRYKSISVPQLYRHLKRMNIRQVGIRQRPANYPPDTADRIIRSLGYAPIQTAAALVNESRKRQSGIITMKQVRAERRKSRAR